MIASASAEQYRDAIVSMVDDPNLDALVVIFIPPLLTKPEDVARAIAEAVQAVARKKPVLAVFMSSKGVPEELRVPEARVPSYAFPESAAIALARVTRYAEWLKRPVPDLTQIDREQRAQAARILRGAMQRGAEWLAPDDVAALLACYGLPYIEQRVVPTPEEAGAAAAALGGQVVLKAIAPGLIHRSDVGAVRLRLEGADAVRTTAVEMAARLAGMGAAPTGFVVQRMAAPGVEMLAGVVHDRQFGPVVACGAGGVLVELLGDVRVRLAPLTRDDAAEMLRSLKTFPLLTGYRGQPARDVEALLDIIVRTSLLADDLPEIAEMDCNPILVHERGATIVDARIRVARVEPPLPLGARR
jgi:acyl-CoA synthetase (NDP forming)